MRLSDLIKETRVIHLVIGGQSLEVEYRVHAYTPEVEAELGSAENKPASTLARVLSKMVARWTLEDDDGNMYPVSTEAMSKLPLQFMIRIFQAIAEDMRPNLMSTGS